MHQRRGVHHLDHGTEANASRKLVSVCSEYKYWGTLVAEVVPAARPAAAFDITEAEQLLVRAFEESNAETMNAGGLKSKMLTLDAASRPNSCSIATRSSRSSSKTSFAVAMARVLNALCVAFQLVR